MKTITIFGNKIHFGITQKMLMVLVGVLVLTALLGAMLASYFTHQQNEKAAFSNLNNQLLAWQKDLQTSTEHLKNIAIATTNDRVVLHQLTEILTFESNITHNATQGGQAEISRTLAYHKTVSINRLALALRTGGFTSISVYTQGQLSHYISSTEVGMMLEQANHHKTWVAAPIEKDGNLPLEHWPAWHQRAVPTIATSSPMINDRPGVNFSFPNPTQTNIEFIIPVQGFLEDMLVDAEINPEIQVFSDLSIAGETNYTQLSTSNKPPIILAVIVFRKVLDNTYLESLAEKTGTSPILFSPDGQHQQPFDTIKIIPSEMLLKARATLTESVPSVIQNIVYNNHNSFYAALLPWQLEQQPRLILGMVASRAGTLQNIKQTVAAILLTSSIILFLSLALGIWLAKKLMDPITNLTSAVKEITSSIRLESGEQKQRKHHALETLTLINSSAPDEVGDLAKAFNILLAEQQQLFENLELRVKERTSALHMQTRYLRTLIDMLPMWAWFKDTKSRYLAVNQSFAESCGLSPAKLIGKSDSEVLPSKLAEQQIADDIDVMHSRQQKTVELQKNIPDGTIWLETFKAPVIDEDGAILGTV
ncbi:MAG: PAS domain-containing protein, partial [Methylophilus sp.]